MNPLDLGSLDTIVHVIQASLSPVFLLTAIASLLSGFNTRLTRISDQVEKLAEAARTDRTTGTRKRLALLKLRSHCLDVAVALGAVGGACTCATVLALFLGLVRANATSTLLLLLFGAAIACTMGALGAFLTEMLLASRGLREEVEQHTDAAAAAADAPPVQRAGERRAS